MVALKVLLGWSILIGIISLPFLYAFWKSWDRPSRAALEEQARRVEERDMRDAFIREEAKLREQEHLMALTAIRERRSFAYDAPSSEGIQDVLSLLSGEKKKKTEHELTIEEIAALEKIPDSVEVPDIEPDDSPEEELARDDIAAGPVALSIELPAEVADAGQEDSGDSAEQQQRPLKELDADVDWPEWE